MKRVVILKVGEYDRDLIYLNIKKAIERYFSHLNFTRKIVLKPNLLTISSPEEAITTHPILIEAVADIFSSSGEVYIADNPGGFISHKDIDYVYTSLGIKKLAEKIKVNLLYSERITLKDNIPFSWWVEDTCLINLPKLKTHNITGLTLCVKNLYGTISGLYKSKLHFEYPHYKDFVKVLFKLYHLIKPTLNIVDGILALEGDGPAKGGVPKKLGLVIIGDDALYTDYVITRLLKMDKINILIKEALLKGLLREENYQIFFEDKLLSDRDLVNLSSKMNFSFLPPSLFITERIPSFVLSCLENFIKVQPKINQKTCAGCYKCVEVCPAHTIDFINHKAKIDYRNCINCMCCKEVCRFGAVGLKKSFLVKLFEHLS